MLQGQSHQAWPRGVAVFRAAAAEAFSLQARHSDCACAVGSHQDYHCVPPLPPEPMTRRRMLRHNAIESWQTMQKTGWRCCLMSSRAQRSAS
ncbi:MAG: DUF1651 domain-containing protein [Cyanobacteriota bacterium]|nr:DUF1651 domain-containing protein [Cyanobacteriota bacterium]